MIWHFIHDSQAFMDSDPLYFPLKWRESISWTRFVWKNLWLSWSFLVEYRKNVSLFVIWELLKVIWRNEERSKFRQQYYRNSNKKYKRGERNDVMARVRKFWISVMRLPKFLPTQACCPKVLEGGVAVERKWIAAIMLLKL